MDGKIIFKEKIYHMKWISSNNKILLKYLKYFMVKIVNDKTKKKILIIGSNNLFKKFFKLFYSNCTNIMI